MPNSKEIDKIAKNFDEFDPLSRSGFKVALISLIIVVAVITILYIAAPLIILKDKQQDKTDEILGEDVTISGYIPWAITLKITSEGRLPPTNNQQNDIALEIRYPGTQTVVYSESLSTNNQGEAALATITRKLFKLNFFWYN